MNIWLILLAVMHVFTAFHGTWHNSFKHKRYYSMLTSFVLYLTFGSLLFAFATLRWLYYLTWTYPSEANDTHRHVVTVRTHLFDFYEQNGVNMFFIEASVPTPGDIVEVVEATAGGKSARCIRFTIRDILDTDYTSHEVLGLPLEQSEHSERYLVVCDKQHII